jgi:hypothetical protein
MYFAIPPQADSPEGGGCTCEQSQDAVVACVRRTPRDPNPRCPTPRLNPKYIRRVHTGSDNACLRTLHLNQLATRGRANCNEWLIRPGWSEFEPPTRPIDVKLYHRARCFRRRRHPGLACGVGRGRLGWEGRGAWDGRRIRLGDGGLSGETEARGEQGG